MAQKEVAHRINSILVSPLDVEQRVERVNCELRDAFDAAWVNITVLDNKGERFRFLPEPPLNPQGGSDQGTGRSVQGTSIGRVVHTRLPLLLPSDTENDSWLDECNGKRPIRSALLFPLINDGKVIGTLNLGKKGPDPFTEEDLQDLKQLTEGLAFSIHQVLLYRETKERLDEVTVLHEMTKVSSSPLGLDSILAEIIRSLNAFFNVDRLGLLLMDENTKRLTVHPSFWGLPVEEPEAFCPRWEKGIAGAVIERGEALRLNCFQKTPDAATGHEIFSEMAVPLKADKKVVGVLIAQSREPRPFSDHEFQLFELSGKRLAMILETVRSEERYRTVVESALDGVLVMGEDCHVTYVNDRLLEILGCPKETVMGGDFREFLDEKSRILLDRINLQRLKGASVPSCYELSLFHKNGEKRNIEMSSTSMRDSEGNTNTIAFVKDITEKRRLEEQLLQAEKLRAIADLASGVAHDFNNALAIIVGNAQLLLLDAKDKDVTETLRVIERVAKESSQKVRRLQEFARDKGSQPLTHLDVNGVIEEAVEFTKPKWETEARGKGITIELACHLQRIPPAAGKISELQEVMTDLILNAIEAMPEGGRIDVRTYQKKHTIYIQVSDTGVGMNEETKRKVFEPFFTTKPFSNSGLGLSMAYGIIKRLGGEVEVESTEGRGTTFTIALPIKAHERESVSVCPDRTIGHPARVLVIDDEELVRILLADILVQGRHQVVVAEDGEKGIRLFKESPFDMVLTDLGMPGMSGWEVTKGIKQINPNTPVGIITGWGSEMNPKKQEEMGADFIVSKPFDYQKILNLVAETMESRALSRMS